MLLDAGADAEARDKVHGYTPLMHACIQASEVAVQALLDHVRPIIIAW